MLLAEIAVTVTQLQSEVIKIQGKLDKLASSARHNLTQTAAALHDVAHHLDEIDYSQTIQVKIATISATYNKCRKQDAPDPLKLGDFGIQRRASGDSDIKIANETDYEVRYIQQVIRLASLPEIRPYVENDCIAPDVTYRLIQKYEVSDVIWIIEREF